MAGPRSRPWADGALNAGLVVGALLVGVLLYGLVTRTVQPRTTPERTPVVDDSLGIGAGGARVQVEVLNASGRDGLAAAATAHLRRRGFDVLRTDTAPLQDTTLVLVQRGSPLDGRHVAAALDVPVRAVGDDSTSRDYDPDVIVRLGRDYPARAPFPLAAAR